MFIIIFYIYFLKSNRKSNLKFNFEKINIFKFWIIKEFKNIIQLYIYTYIRKN